MDFGQITDPRKQEPFDREKVPSMKNHTPRNDRDCTSRAALDREERQQEENRTASITGGQRNPEKPENKGKGK
jgi:hypothetical protein